MSVINGEASDYILASEPIQTVASNHGSNKYRAFILDCQLAGDTQERGVTLPQGDAPMFTVTSGKNGKQPVRAWLVESKNANQQYGDSMRRDDKPATTVITDHKDSHQPKAYLIGSENAGQEWGGTKWGDEPSFTITTEQKPRAWLSQGRVVSMTPRALARFQSLPDSYILPDNKKLACTVIGNMVPPLLYQKIIKPLVGVI